MEEITFDDIPYFDFKGLVVDAKVVSVYDGDTISVIFPFKGELVKYRVRCYGYDSPEMKPRLNNPNRDIIKKGAKLAKEKMIEYVGGKIVKLECGEFDKYGRILGTIKLNDENINEKMIKGGYGNPYFGGTK